MDKKVNVREIIRRLYTAFPEPKCELHFTTPFELLAATILSAQATDKKVNEITPSLFHTFPTIADYAHASPGEIDRYVNKVLFHNNKSKHIHLAALKIMNEYDGRVPDSMEKLLTLAGVARKTANVILGTVFNKAEGIVVDTHMIRLANKLGLTAHKDPVKIEQDLMKIVPRDKWIDFGHLITLHGRYQCPAKPHDCTECVLDDLCPEYSQWNKVRPL